jgi:transposase
MLPERLRSGWRWSSYSREVLDAEAFCAGHLHSFEFFGGVPRSVRYDNTKLAVARILG